MPSNLPTSPSKALTQYPQGSLRELWQISFPLMVSLMSVSAMLFLDRLFLAHYSLDALNASVNASMLAQLMQFWCITTVCIAEVYVGRYNGACRYHKLGQPVWQMIWLSMGTCFLFIPIGLFAGPFLFYHENYNFLEIEYFKWLMCFGPMAAISGALSAFYIGRGKVRFVTCSMVIANGLNIFLDFLLIFGYEPWIPSLGIKGAAIATGIAQTIQSLILFIAFIGWRNRQNFGTGNWRFHKRMFWRCLKTGMPNAFAHTLEILAWVLIFHLMTLLGPDYITVVAVAQSILFLFTFMTEGISKGATAIASNLIGSNQPALVWKILKSGVKFYAVIFIFLGGVLAVNPDPMILWFLPENITTVSPSTWATLHTACFWVWLFFFFDGVSWLLIGLLTAAGDTRFIMKVGGAGPWLVALLPIYIFVVQLGASADITWMLIAFYGMVSCTIYWLRFRSEKWRVLAYA